MPFRTLLASHKRVLGNLKQISEGALSIVRAAEVAARVGGEAGRTQYRPDPAHGALPHRALSTRCTADSLCTMCGYRYLRQMEMLATQQRLLACQLADSLLPLTAELPAQL